KQLMDVAVTAGAQAVKFQKRNPEVAVPEHQKSKIRSTPWGEMTYIDYKHRVEFGIEEYAEIDRYAKEVGLQWFASRGTPPPSTSATAGAIRSAARWPRPR